MYPFCRPVTAGLIVAASTLAAETPVEVKNAVSQLEQAAAKAPAGLAVEFRVRAAQALLRSSPELAGELVRLSIDQLRSGRNWRLTPEIIRTLATLAPSDAVSVLPRMAPDYGEYVMDGLAELNQIATARSVYRNMLARGGRVTAAVRVLIRLINEKSPDVGNVYRDMLSGFNFDALEPDDAWWILSQLTMSIQDIAPDAAVEGISRLLDAVSKPKYGQNATSSYRGVFQVGSETVAAANSRETLLLLAGAQLQKLAPLEFEKRKALFSQWKLTGPLVVKSISPSSGVPGRGVKTVSSTRRMLPEIGVVSDHIEQLQGQAAGPDRDQLIIQLSGEVRRLTPSWGKLDRALTLCAAAVKGEPSTSALAAASAALAYAIRDSQPTLDPTSVSTSFSEDYLRLAELVRYEHVEPPFADPALDAANALLALRERILEQTGFVVASEDGKPYTLVAAVGKVTLVSFVTTSCSLYGGCERALPDLEKLYKEFGDKGLAVFAITSEDRDFVTDNLRGETYTVPLFFDPGHKVAEVFGNPYRSTESFLFDRQGKLVAREITIRTERELREILKKAGIE
jgi:peroxiredoxin